MKKNIISTTYFLIAIWVCFFASHIIPINQLGIIPRSLNGTIGIILSPFLHGNLDHIISNSSALIVFATIFSLIESEKLILKIIFLIILSGFLTWIIGRPAIHIGASGLIFALYGYLVSLAYFNKKILYIFLSLTLLFFYGYIIVGIFPTNQPFSWEAHLAGLISGIILAKFSTEPEEK